MLKQQSVAWWRIRSRLHVYFELSGYLDWKNIHFGQYPEVNWNKKCTYQRISFNTKKAALENSWYKLLWRKFPWSIHENCCKSKKEIISQKVKLSTLSRKNALEKKLSSISSQNKNKRDSVNESYKSFN